jgi:hypothetical protein
MSSGLVSDDAFLGVIGNEEVATIERLISDNLNYHYDNNTDFYFGDYLFLVLFSSSFVLANNALINRGFNNSRTI